MRELFIHHIDGLWFITGPYYMHGCRVLARCTTRQAAEAARRLLSL